MTNIVTSTRILLVEDNPADARLMSELVREAQGARFEISIAATLAEAVDHVAGHDIVLLDLSLPDAHGTSAVTRMVEAAHKAPVIVLTGNTDETAAFAALSLGADDYLIKSDVTSTLIGRAILYAIERRRSTERDREMLALEIARNESARAAERARLLDGISAALVTNVALDAIIETLTRHIVDAKLASACHIQVVEPLGARYSEAPPAGAPEPVGDASVLVLPLSARGRSVGVMRLERGTNEPVSEDALRLVEEIARRASMAIDNALLYRAKERALRARDEMFAIVSHDLRNPLSVIALVLHTARQQLSAGRLPRAELLMRGVRAVSTMQRLVDDLLDVARIDAGTLVLDKGKIDVIKVLEDAIELQAGLAAEKKIQLRSELGKNAIVEADSGRLMQVMANLLGNAIKFTPAGGTITVTCTPSSGFVRISVTDTGSGIDTDSLPHVFDRFYQTDRRKDGAGLGLAISKGIVEAHGGQIGATSTLGEGSTFWLTLPIT